MELLFEVVLVIVLTFALLKPLLPWQEFALLW